MQSDSLKFHKDDTILIVCNYEAKLIVSLTDVIYSCTPWQPMLSSKKKREFSMFQILISIKDFLSEFQSCNLTRKILFLLLDQMLILKKKKRKTFSMWQETMLSPNKKFYICILNEDLFSILKFRRLELYFFSFKKKWIKRC